MAAAAVLGSTARRLGALRQTQEAAAVARLSSRFAHTEAQPQPQPHPHCSCKFGKEAFLKATQKKKEELYEAMAEWHKKYGDDPISALRQKNRSLLRELSDHVKRPGDSSWEWAQTSKEFHGFLNATGGLTLFLGGPYLLYKAISGVVHLVDECKK